MYLFEGNVGVGKTTLISLLPGYLSDLNVIPEPIDIWNRSVLGKSLLANFYTNPKRWAYTLETLTLICRSQDHLREQQGAAQTLLERSIYSGHYCFAQTGFKNGFLSGIEWTIYNKWAEFLILHKCLPPRGFIYLKADPEICFERTQHRNRPSERSITLKYLKQIGRAHDDFLIAKKELPEKLASVPVLVLDCNDDFLHDTEKMAEHADKIKAFINK